MADELGYFDKNYADVGIETAQNGCIIRFHGKKYVALSFEDALKVLKKLNKMLDKENE